MENFVAYCWFHQALSTRTSSETARLASWFTALTTDGQNIQSLISLLDSIRSGWFDLICLLPATATLSRAQHFGNGQKPLRSRTEPFGLQSLDPNSTSKATASNQQLEFAFWFLKEALTYPTKKVGVILVFPEDLGGWLESGPSSIWGLKEFRSLEDYHGGRRGAVYLCQIGDSDHMRPTGIYTNLDEIFNFIHLGWPELVTTVL